MTQLCAVSMKSLCPYLFCLRSLQAKPHGLNLSDQRHLQGTDAQRAAHRPPNSNFLYLSSCYPSLHILSLTRGLSESGLGERPSYRFLAITLKHKNNHKDKGLDDLERSYWGDRTKWRVSRIMMNITYKDISSVLIVGFYPTIQPNLQTENKHSSLPSGLLGDFSHHWLFFQNLGRRHMQSIKILPSV